MVESFDPYHKWLGILPAEQPPHHYRLLGIAPFEEDLDVINAAVLQRTAYVRNYQAGKFADHAAKLLGEIANAQACLLDRERRRTYNDRLRTQLAPPPAKTPPPTNVAWEQAPQLAPRLREMPSAQRNARRTMPAWLLPLGAMVVVAAILVGVALSLSGRDDQSGEPAANQVAQATNNSSELKAASDRGLVKTLPAIVKGGLNGEKRTTELPPSSATAPNKKPPAPIAPSLQPALAPEQKPEQPPATTPVFPVAPPPEPDFPLGVEADRIVVWNQHNGNAANDRGSTMLRLTLFQGNTAVKTFDKVSIPWAANKDTFVEVKVDPVRFDRLRVDVLGVRTSGGLAEVQVFKGKRNLALGAPCIASSIFDDRFPASRVTDGATTSSAEFVGYWLLQNQVTGYVEVDLALAEQIRQSSVRADRVVLWNTHNGKDNNVGAQECNLALWLNGKRVGGQNGIAMPWLENQDLSKTVNLPDKEFDFLSVEVSKCFNSHGGLAEVQVLQGDKNIAAGCPVVATNWFSVAYRPATLTDEVTSSAQQNIGYWVSTDTKPALAAIDLRWSDRALRTKAGIVGMDQCVNKGAWSRGLKWLARGVDLELARLAEADLAELERQMTDSAPEAISLGDRWWLQAEKQTTQPARDALMTRALFWYAKARHAASESDLVRIVERLDNSLPRLPADGLLYFAPGVPVKSLWVHPRQHVVRVAGVEYAHSIELHPSSHDTATMTFSVPAGRKTLRGAAAIADSAIGRTKTPLIFKIVGDGRTLWTSPTVQDVNDYQSFQVNIEGVRSLELIVECPQDYNLAHAVWLDPRWE